MATKITIMSETNYSEYRFDSSTINKVLLEECTNDDTMAWHIEVFCKFLLGNGYSLETIQKFIDFDGAEVFEKEEK